MVTLLAPLWLLSNDVVASAQNRSEHDLAIRARDGDRHAQREMYELYAPRVRRFVVDMLRDRDAASDALQETFVRVFRRIASLDDPARVAGWIFGIARRVCLEQRRRALRHGSTNDLHERALAVPHPGPSPEAVVILVESAALLEHALDKLTPDRRAVLLMRCDHLLSYEEIATAMGFSLAKVKVEIFRARSALRSALRKDDGP